MDIDENEKPSVGKGWTEVPLTGEIEKMEEEEEEEDEDEPLAEPGVGKGLAAALSLLKGRGELQSEPEWGGRTMDKKKSKLVGIVGDEQMSRKEIHIERKDEFGREVKNFSSVFH